MTIEHEQKIIMMQEQNIPPKYFLRFFRWFCHPELKKYIEGDLVELYEESVQEYGKRKADIKFIIDVLLLFRPGIIKPWGKNQNLNHYGMYKSYFKIGWRNLVKNKGYSFINVGGLALGMTVAMLIGLWIYDELSFDKFHPHYNELAQVMQHQTFDGVKQTTLAIPRPLEHELRTHYDSDLMHLSMATWTNVHILNFGEQKISKSGNFVQEDFPEMFSLHMVEGTRDGLRDPASILLSASTAKALFGTDEPLNQVVKIDNTMDVKVTGVYKDLPYNTTFRDLQFISSWELFAASEPWIKVAEHQWENNSFQLFAEISPQANIEEISEKIKDVKAKSSEKERIYKPEIFLNPMRNWHLRSEWSNGKNIGGRIQLVWLFGIIGGFVLLLACINFMNLSTARSEKRAKEVGIRMTIGSVRSQLINQFLSESFLVVLLAFVVSMAMATASLSWFNVLADKKIEITWTNLTFWIISLSFIAVTSLVAGSYPSLYLSSFRPVNVLKGTFKVGRFASLPRKILVVIQFTVSVTLIIGTIIIYKQIQFSKNRPLGYNHDGLVMIEMRSPDFYGKYDVLRTELKRAGAIEEMSESSSPLTGIWSNSNELKWEGKDPNRQESFGTIYITPEYGETIGWTIQEGRDISREFPSDSAAIIINEAAVKYMGVKDPIGMEIEWYNNQKFHVVGVVTNMVVESPYSPVRPTIYMVNYGNVNWINLKLNPAKSAHQSMTAIESTFKKIIPAAPFDYKFVDDDYARKFNAEERIGKLAAVFGVLAVFISSLGLFGLASFVAEQRTKEIGIRKVLGASVSGLWKMLSFDFIVLVIIACIVAVPIAYYSLRQWLLQYNYHTDIPWWIFAGSALGAIVITLLTVSYQAVKAALADPVKSLRTE
jgi:putative ABC transport system permease protein